jgi:hypothetical protein
MKGYSVCSLNRRFFEEENDYTVLGNVGNNIKEQNQLLSLSIDGVFI